MAASVNECNPDNEETRAGGETVSDNAAVEQLRRELRQEMDTKLMELVDGLEKGYARRTSLASAGTPARTPTSRRGSIVKFKDKVSEVHYDTKSPGVHESTKEVLSKQDSDGMLSSVDSEGWDSDNVSEMYSPPGEATPLLCREHKRNTLSNQAKIARSVSTPLRVLGVALGFITVVCLWEATDRAMHLASPAQAIRLTYYLMLTASASICLALSHEWVVYAESTLLPSFAYALSTLFLGIGAWGVLVQSMLIMVPEKGQLFCWFAAGLVSFAGSLFYGVQTRHNVILDIASCATSLGLEGEDNASFSRLSALT